MFPHAVCFLVFVSSQLREDELVTRLRIKSARVRAPAPAFSSEVDEDTTVTPVERIQHPHTADPQEPPLFSQITREEAEGEEQQEEEEEREAAGDGSRKCRADTDRAEDGERRRRSEDGEREKKEEEEEEEEETQVEELENDSSFLRAHDKEEIF